MSVVSIVVVVAGVTFNVNGKGVKAKSILNHIPVEVNVDLSVTFRVFDIYVDHAVFGNTMQ
jgi:hypothetical protein